MALSEQILKIMSNMLSVDGGIDNSITKVLTTGGVVTISGTASAIAVITFSISFVRGLNSDVRSKTTIAIMELLFVSLFFFMSTGYLYIVQILQELHKMLFESVFSMYLSSLQSDLKYLLSTIHEQGKNGLDLLAIQLFNSSIDLILLSTVIFAIIILLFVLFIVYKAFFIIALLTGPLCAALSFVFPDILKNWRNFMLMGVCYPVFVGVGFIAIRQTGIIRIVAGNISQGLLFPALITSVLCIATLLCIPKIMAEIFGIKVADITGLIISILLFLNPLKFLKVAKIAQSVKKVKNLKKV